jgi:hypothetical protein
MNRPNGLKCAIIRLLSNLLEPVKLSTMHLEPSHEHQENPAG